MIAMFGALLWIVSLLSCIHGQQVLLLTQSDDHARHETWQTAPSPDDTGHLIFDSVANLLKHWSNTYYRNGHTIVPGEITTGTLLFHGRWNEIPPTTHDWVSFDADHSLMFAGFGEEGHLVTYAVRRPLNILYFDGSSASNMPSGTMDSQDIVAFGHVTNNWRNERDLILSLCEWGKAHNLDGFVRMEFDFEMMICNFTNGLEVTSNVAVLPTGYEQGLDGSYADAVHHSHQALNPNTTEPPQYPPRRPGPGGPGGPPERWPRAPSKPPEGWQGSLRTRGALTLEGLVAGNWHNYAALNGVRLDLSGILTFYDPRYKSLVEARRNDSSRVKHRLVNMTGVDSQLFQTDLQIALSKREVRSGVDWGQLISHIVERHQQRLELLEGLLTSTDEGPGGQDFVNTTEVVWNVRQHVFTMLAPYLSRSSVPHPNDTSPASNASWISPAMEVCKSTYTSHILRESCSTQELLLKASIEATVGQICRTLGLIWTTAFDAESLPSEVERQSRLSLWRVETKRLKEWLGWAVWIKCDPACTQEELCTLPQWPWDIRSGDEDMTPRCVSRLRWQSNFPGRRRPSEPEENHAGRKTGDQS